MIIEVKCPYCGSWNTMTQYDYDMNDTHVCMECYQMFFIDSNIIQMV